MKLPELKNWEVQFEKDGEYCHFFSESNYKVDVEKWGDLAGPPYIQISTEDKGVTWEVVTNYFNIPRNIYIKEYSTPEEAYEAIKNLDWVIRND